MSSNPRKLRRIQWWKQHKKSGDPSSDKDCDSRKKFEKSHKRKKVPSKTPTNSKPMDEHEENKTKNRYIIFVGNLPFDLTKDDIIQHFRCAGNVDFRMLTKKDTGMSKGCGFLELDDITSYKKALNLHHSTLGGRKINVEVTCGGGGSGEKRMEKLNEKKKKFRKKRAKKQDSSTSDNEEDKKNTSCMKEKYEVKNKNEDSATDEKMEIKSEKKSKKRKQEITEEEQLASTKKKTLKESGAITAIVKELQLETLLEDKKTGHLDISSLGSDKEGKKKEKLKLEKD